MSGSPHIFVVDDEAAARDMVGDYLKMHGFEVTLCDGGASLRAGLAKDNAGPHRARPQHAGGGRAVDRPRPQEIDGNVPVIMLTATASPIDRVVGLELGADDYLAKPCELRELVARIRSVLRRASQAAAAAGRRRPSRAGRRSASGRSGSISRPACCRTTKASTTR